MAIKLPPHLIVARFIKRPNRFLAVVEINGQKEQAFIPDPGRLQELLVPGTEVYLARHQAPNRKTAYDMVLAKHEDTLVSVDSRLPNRLLVHALRDGELPPFAAYQRVRPEVAAGQSRLDFYLEGEGQKGCFLEAKSVTMVQDGVALFPDAPTARGARHVRELASLKTAGFRAAVVFIIQRSDAHLFRPHGVMDAAFATALQEAASLGVEVYAYKCRLTLQEMNILGEVPVDLG